MGPTVEEQQTRVYSIQLKHGETVYVTAATICRPTLDDPFYRLKREGQVVGEFEKAQVVAWWIANEPAVAM